jgi:hypothetical protein
MLETLNTGMIVVSVLSIIHLLQERFLQIPEIAGLSTTKYVVLRSSLALYAALLPIQLLFPTSPVTCAMNTATAAVALITTLSFD